LLILEGQNHHLVFRTQNNIPNKQSVADTHTFKQS
jgi:hypothetical protein